MGSKRSARRNTWWYGMGICRDCGATAYADRGPSSKEPEAWGVRPAYCPRCRAEMNDTGNLITGYPPFGVLVDGSDDPAPPKSGLGLRFWVLRRDKYRCRICGRDASDGVKLEVDHKVPVMRGGASTAENLWTLCFDCNRGKYDQMLDVRPPSKPANKPSIRPNVRPPNKHK